MKGAAVFVLVVMVMSTVDAMPRRKREGLWNTLLEGGIQLLDDFITNYDTEKSIFENFSDQLDFDEVVANLIEKVHSNMTMTVCNGACHKFADTVLGSMAGLADDVCGPVCRASLMKLEDIAAQAAADDDGEIAAEVAAHDEEVTAAEVAAQETSTVAPDDY